IPGVISHSTVLVEHPELVAERIGRFAKVVGRENVIAGADCGFATFAGSKEVHPSIVWEKFRSLVEGARIASKELWGRTEGGLSAAEPPQRRGGIMGSAALNPSYNREITSWRAGGRAVPPLATHRPPGRV